MFLLQVKQDIELPIQVCGTAVAGKLTWAIVVLFLMGTADVYIQGEQ